MQRGHQRFDISKRPCRGSSTNRTIFKLTITSSWIRCRLITSSLSFRHRYRRSSCRADCRQSSDTIEEHDLRAIKTPWKVSTGLDENGRPVDNTGCPWPIAFPSRRIDPWTWVERLFLVEDLTQSHQFSIFDIEYFSGRDIFSYKRALDHMLNYIFLQAKWCINKDITTWSAIWSDFIYLGIKRIVFCE